MAIPVDNTWTLTFDDEFNGTSLNKTMWGDNWLGNPGAITKPVNTEEICAYDPAQVSVSEGYLHLKAVQSPVTVNGIDYQYRSGLVNTHDSFQQAYGYFESRIYLQGSNGQIDNWPAFWTDGENWPVDGEMDILEGLGGEAAYHFHSSTGNGGKSVAGDFTGWHTYGALWEPGKVSYYYDNQLVGEITSIVTGAPMYLILNLGIGIHSIVNVPGEMMVDWVHVYSSDTAATGVTPQANYTGPGGTGTTVVTPPPPTYTELTGTSGSDTISGSDGVDHIFGYAGRDTLKGMSADDDIYAGDGNDTADGGSGNDMMHGEAGNDSLSGGLGRDAIEGGAGGDQLSGGDDADLFVFTSLSDSFVGKNKYDTITDFNHAAGDKIDLSGVDANSQISGDQAFAYIGTSSFTGHAGELRWAAQGGVAYVVGDVDGDRKADLQICLSKMMVMDISDFIL